MTTSTPRCDALEDTLPWNDTYIPLRDLARNLERENAQLRGALETLADGLDDTSCLSHADLLETIRKALREQS